MAEKLLETKRCLLCLRIPFELCYQLCSKLYPDEATRYRVAEHAEKMIRDAYLKEPYTLSGHAPIALASAAVYLSSIILDTPELRTRTTMEAIHMQRNDYGFETKIDYSKVRGATNTAIKQNYRLLERVLDIEV